MINQKKFSDIISKFSSISPILVIGDVGVDKYTKGRVNRISPEAPVPIVEVYEEWNKLGLAANVSDNLQSLGVKSTLCGVIGDDTNADALENLVEEVGLSTWGLVRDAKRMTTFKERVVTNIQQICRVDYETKEPIAIQTQERILKRVSEFLEMHSAVILEDYGKGFFTKKLTQDLIALSHDMGKFVAVDPSRTTPPEFYKGVDLLKPNQVESEMMAHALGYSDTGTEQIAKILIDKLSLKKLIITLGSEGMAIFDEKENFKMKTIPTLAREVFDVSGAGDTAISTIIASIASGASLEEAAWIGNCASGVVVGKKGTALVNVNELNAFYSELVSK